MQKQFTSNPHYAKPLHIRAAFAVWLFWRNHPLLKEATCTLPIAAALGGALYLFLAWVQVF